MCVTFNDSSAKHVSLVFRANPLALSSFPGQLSNLLDDQVVMKKRPMFNDKPGLFNVWSGGILVWAGSLFFFVFVGTSLTPNDSDQD